MPHSYKIIEEGRNCQHVFPCRRAAFLIDGEAYFKALAEALKNARRAVYIIGWDFDSRIHLIREKGHPDAETGLGAFLNALVHEHSELRIYILDWDFPMLYALEREPLPIFRIGMQSHRRVRFEMDGNHPLGASQHQKLVVVDDRLAFVGGLDLTACRWDTPDHAPGDARRVDNGKKYQPFHDVQMMVEGGIAEALGNLARGRWLKATGKKLTSPSPSGPSPWPASFEPDLEDLGVGLARTEPAYNGQKEIKEIEKLYEDAILGAQDIIYVENQYFTASKVGRTLAARLAEENGPQVILVLPQKCSGWLEEGTMGVLRARLLKSLRESDRWNRLRIYYPTREDFAGEYINLHAKVMIVDDIFLRIGSANLNNRSMGLDSECDLAVDSGSDERIRRAISRFRNRLLAEHCGTSPAEMGEALANHGSAGEAIASFSGGIRHLEPLEAEVDKLVDELVPDSDLIDPEKPISMEDLTAQFAPAGWEGTSEKGRISSRFLKIAAALLLILAFYATWKWTPLGEWLDTATLANWGKAIRESPFTPLIVLAAYILAGFVMFPVTVLIFATILAFGPLAGFFYAMSGSLANAMATYILGRTLGRRTIRNFVGKRLNELSQRLARQGLLAIVTVRILPVAPFTVVNIVAGASHINFRDYFWGTLLGMLPGILALAAAGKGIGEIFFSGKPGSPLFSILLLGTAIAAILILRRILKKKEGKSPFFKRENDDL